MRGVGPRFGGVAATKTTAITTMRALSTTELSELLEHMSNEDLDLRLQAITAEKKRRQSTLIIGAAGAVGKRLCAVLARRCQRTWCRRW